jgi:hypothetical protein
LLRGALGVPGHRAFFVRPGAGTQNLAGHL